jgi:hypothetical protein
MKEYTFEELHALWGHASKTQTAERIQAKLGRNEMADRWEMRGSSAVRLYSFLSQSSTDFIPEGYVFD